MKPFRFSPKNPTPTLYIGSCARCLLPVCPRSKPQKPSPGRPLLGRRSEHTTSHCQRTHTAHYERERAKRLSFQSPPEKLVERKGFEPSTPGLQSRCSTN